MTELDSFSPSTVRRKSKLIWLVIIVVGLSGAVVGLVLLVPWSKPTIELPANVVSQIKAFTPYYFKAEIPGGFTLKADSVTLNQDILFFVLENRSNQMINGTEQLLPAPLANQIYPSLEKVTGVDGDAWITYDGTKAIGALYSVKHGHAQTMVLLTTTDPVPKATIGDLLRAFRSIR